MEVKELKRLLQMYVKIFEDNKKTLSKKTIVPEFGTFEAFNKKIGDILDNPIKYFGPLLGLLIQEDRSYNKDNEQQMYRDNYALTLICLKRMYLIE